MAPYAMCHLKLDLMLQKTGYKPKGKNSRCHVYLTNALEEAHPDTGTLWITMLSHEASDANEVKRDTPVMAIIGNPPYNPKSKNKGSWIRELLKPYKLEPAGGPLKERNSKWLNDDYVKFIRTAEHYIERNKSGVLAFITNHGFIDNPTFRGMRFRLLQTFSKIYIIDLHGNSNKKERTPDGKTDENVFDIEQGVSIAVFVKGQGARKDQLAKVFHSEFYGTREEKYKRLFQSRILATKFHQVKPVAKFYLLNKVDLTKGMQEDSGFKLDELFQNFSTGYYTSKDEVVIGFSESEIRSQITKFYDKLGQNIFFNKSKIRQTTYRPFDNRLIYFEPSSLTRSRQKFVNAIDFSGNSILILGKNTRSKHTNHFFLSNRFSELKCAEYTLGSYMMPLYLYPEVKATDMFNTPSPHGGEGAGGGIPNLNPEIVAAIAEKIGLKFEDDGASTALSDRRKRPTKSFAPIDLLDYIYGVLHSPNYREKYKEFLKIDFPRVPYPESAKAFWAFVELGGELRALHLMESPKLAKLITKFSVSGSNEVEKISFEPTAKGLGKVFINKDQYFDVVPEVAWSFYIGGYQPAQKWLKDRKGRV